MTTSDATEARAASAPEGPDETNVPGVSERYRVLGQIGRGGMATVYEALDRRTGQRVALKHLLPHRAQGDGHIARLFEREYHTLVQLAHPRIVQAYDYRKTDDGAYYTMELLDGGDLREGAPRPYRQVCALLADVCSALSLLHSRRLVHRDLTPRNVRCTSDGTAKLIDFGAMVPFGTHPRTVGTPSFTAPEAFAGQALDARADIFSLGATAYYALTGRHAYPARTFAALRNAWRSMPPVPSRYAPDVPSELDQLVMSMLQLSQVARPRSAADVLEALGAIANLEADDSLLVQNAFLSTPTLVGRDRELVQIRRQMIRGARGHGGSILITGQAGIGRSRMLDACALEGKLAGALVLNMDHRAAGSGPWCGVRSVLEQLVAALPTESPKLLASAARTLAHVWPGVLDVVPGAVPRPFEQPHDVRPAVHQALGELLWQTSASSFVVLVADDIDELDEPSAAFVALSAGHTRARRMVVAAAIADVELERMPRVAQLLRQADAVLPLEPLSEPDTGRLLSSVFGDAPNVRLLADRLHAISRGVPRAVMELAQHLLDRGTVEYQGGAFILPDAIDPLALPETWTDAMRERMRGLDAPALELARTMALGRLHGLSLDDIARLVPELPSSQLLRAVDGLVRAQLLEQAGERYALSQAAWAPLLTAELDDNAAQPLHARLARFFHDDPTAGYQTAENLLRAGEPERALSVIGAYVKTVARHLESAPGDAPEHLQRIPDNWCATLEALIDASLRLRRPLIERLHLQLHLVQMATLGGLVQRGPVLELYRQLHADSGLRDYAALVDVAEGERLGRAIALAQQRYDATPEAERGMPPGEAIPALARVVAWGIAMMAVSADLEFLASVPSLAPLAPLSAAIAIVDMGRSAPGEMMSGHIDRACDLYVKILALMESPETSGIPPLLHRYMELSYQYALGFAEVLLGRESAKERIRRIESDALFVVNAWRLRQIAALRKGDVETADECAKQVERLQIRNNPPQLLEGGDAWYELMAYAELGDIGRLRQVEQKMQALALRHPAWLHGLRIARAMRSLLRDEPKAALAELEVALDDYAPGELVTWPFAARAYLVAVAQCGELAGARQRGAGMLDIAERAGVTVGMADLHYALAQLALWDRDLPAARDHLRQLFGLLARWPNPLLDGSAHELHARVALAEGDDDTFALALAECQSSFGPARNAHLSARLERLVQDARRGGMLSPEATRPPDDASADRGTSTQTGAMVQRSEPPAARAQRALELAAGRLGSERLLLYVLRDPGPTCIAERGSGAIPEGLNELVKAFIDMEIGSGESIDPSDFTTSTVDERQWTSPGGEPFAVALLSHEIAGGSLVSGAIVYRCEGSGSLGDAARRISEELVTARDAVGHPARL